jgi:pimeloyl-ACP methyl ester carboxylesterase
VLPVHARIPGSRLEVFEHCGHVPQLEYPERFNRLTVEFLAEVYPTSVTIAMEGAVGVAR